MGTFLAILVLLGVIYLWHKFVYAPGKYNKRKENHYGYSSSWDDGDSWFGSYGDSDDSDGGDD